MGTPIQLLNKNERKIALLDGFAMSYRLAANQSETQNRFIISSPTNRRKKKSHASQTEHNLIKVMIIVPHNIHKNYVKDKQKITKKHTHLLRSGELAAAGRLALELPSPHDTCERACLLCLKKRRIGGFEYILEGPFPWIRFPNSEWRSIVWEKSSQWIEYPIWELILPTVIFRPVFSN